MIEDREVYLKELPLKLAEATNSQEVVAAVSELKLTDVRRLCNELRKNLERNHVVADAFASYHDSVESSYIATNVIQTVCYHGDHRHFSFMLKVISHLGSRSRNQHQGFAIMSAIRGAGYLGSPDDVEALLRAGSPWSRKSCGAERPLQNELANAITLMLVKRDGLDIGDLGDNYLERIHAYSGLFGKGTAGFVEEATRRMRAAIGEESELCDLVGKELRIRIELAEEGCTAIGLGYRPGYPEPIRSILEIRFDERLRENPGIQFCEDCGIRMPYITALVFSKLGRCPRCLFVGFRHWLVDVRGVSPELWQKPPENSPVSVDKSPVGPSFYAGRQWDATTILMHDQYLQRVRDFGPSRSFWHNLMMIFTLDDKPYSLKIRGKNRQIVISLSKDIKHPGGLLPEILFRLWQGDIALEHEQDTLWINENASLRIVSDLIGESPMKQWTADWLRNPSTGAPMYVDGYFPKHSLAVEHQGLQHYEPIDFYGGEQAFGQLQQRDRMKRTLLEQHKIDVLYIRYDEVDRITIAEKLTQVLALNATKRNGE
jgi:hypothetical protein